MAKKRANGEGSIHRLPSGSWQVQVMVGYQPDGKRKFKTFTAPTQQAAKKLKLEFDQMRAAGIQTEKDYTFMEWAQIWFEHHKKNVSATTQEGYKYTLRILINHFGHRKLDSIKAFDIEEFLMEKKMEKASSSQLTKLKGMLVQIFDRAAANDLILRNPDAHLEKMKKEHKTPAEAFTKEEEWNKVCDTLFDTYEVDVGFPADAPGTDSPSAALVTNFSFKNVSREYLVKK